MYGIEITVIAVAYVAFSVLLQRKLIDTKRMRKIQAEIKEKSKELTDLSKAKADTAQLMAKQKEVTALMGESMKSSFKPTLVIFPVFIVLYYLVFPAVFKADATVTIPIILSTVGYKYYFFLVTLALGLASSVVILLYDNAKMKKEIIKLEVEEAEKPC